MRTSQQVLEWQNEAKLKSTRALIVRCLEQRCKASVPCDLAEGIQSTEDMDLLLRWFDAAAMVSSFGEFRAAMQPRG